MNRFSLFISISVACFLLSALALSGMFGPLALRKDQDRLTQFLTQCRESKLTIEETVEKAHFLGWKVSPTPGSRLKEVTRVENPTFFLSGSGKYESPYSKRLVRATLHGNGTQWKHHVCVTLADES